MGVEKQCSKSGVSGFFQLFDWNAKSRKKLFSSKTDLSDQPKQKKRSDGNFPTNRLHMMDEDETVARSSIKGSSDYSCASSVTDEEGYGNRGPGVVARLMGLDSLPTSNFMEPYSSPFFDSQSLRDVHYHRRNRDFQHDHQIAHSGHLRTNVEALSRDTMDAKPQKIINRPIEKFQTEILPPKSAKSIPVTHHKLLSPIKSSGFIPSRNAAHIMEAAAKIIEPGPQPTTKAKRPLVSSSSVPMKVRDLKEKVEAAQKLSRLAETSRRPVESSAAKYLKGQSMNNSWNGSVGTASVKASSSEDSTTGSNNKGKSISLALQAKVNVQKREGLYPSGSGSLFGEKEQSEMVSGQPFKSQPNIQRSTNKKASTRVVSSVLKQNNQKQNCAMDREKLPSKPSNSRGKKTLSGDSSIRHKSSSRTLGNSRAGSRSASVAADYKKELPYSNTKNVCTKKRSIDGNFHFQKNQEDDNTLTHKNGNPVEPNSLRNGHISWAEDISHKGMDVVSFTFTAPMTRLTPGSEISRQVKENNDVFGADSDYRGKKVLHNPDSTNRTKLSLGGDALSILLEQKLRELSQAVESSSYKTDTASSSASLFQEMVPALNSTSILHDKWRQEGMHEGKLGYQYGLNFSSSTAPHRLLNKNKLQHGMELMDECSSNFAESRKLLDYRHPSPISVLEPSFVTESCNSNSTDSNSTEGSKPCPSSVQAQEVLGMGPSKKIYSVEADAELSDSASSTSSRTANRMHATTFSVTDYIGSTRWELKYVKEMLCNVELMFRDFALGRTSEIINPHLFGQLENRKGTLESRGDKPKQKQKLLFDCVSECMDLRCRKYANGGYETWAKGLSVVRRKDRLAEEIHKEISGWSDMADFMVDELVDKDMSNQYGKWLDFEVEAFELGVEIEKRILNSLINEVIADILPL